MSVSDPITQETQPMGAQAQDTRYRLTEKGREYLVQAFFEVAECDHQYELVKRGVLGCMKCPHEVQMNRSNVRAGGWNGKR